MPDVIIRDVRVVGVTGKARMRKVPYIFCSYVGEEVLLDDHKLYAAVVEAELLEAWERAWDIGPEDVAAYQDSLAVCG